MALHIIPEPEKDLHSESEDCICEPRFILDDQSGEMVWAHNILDWEGLVEDMVVI